MDPSYTQKLRNSPEECPETPSDANLILDDGSTYPVNKVILAAQSDFFEALFTFEDKTEYKISKVTQEVLKTIIDDFYGISTVFDKYPDRIIISTGCCSTISSSFAKWLVLGGTPCFGSSAATCLIPNH